MKLLRYQGLICYDEGHDVDGLTLAAVKCQHHGMLCLVVYIRVYVAARAG